MGTVVYTVHFRSVASGDVVETREVIVHAAGVVNPGGFLADVLRAVETAQDDVETRHGPVTWEVPGIVTTDWE